jgi:hypothetical protein
LPVFGAKDGRQRGWCAINAACAKTIAAGASGTGGVDFLDSLAYDPDIASRHGSATGDMQLYAQLRSCIRVPGSAGRPEQRHMIRLWLTFMKPSDGRCVPRT